LEPEDAKEPSSESYSRVVNEYIKEEEKKGEKSLPRSKAEVSSVSSIDLNDMLSDSFDKNRGKYLPLEQLHKKTKNRNAGQKVHEAKQVAEEGSLQISSIDSIELNNLLNDSHRRNRRPIKQPTKSSLNQDRKAIVEVKQPPQNDGKKSVQVSSVSSIEFNDIIDESFYRKRGRKTPTLEALKKTKDRVKQSKKEKPETMEPSQLQISCIDTIEQNKMLLDADYKEKVLSRLPSGNK